MNPDWAQQAETSATSTGGEPPFSKVPDDDSALVSTQHAVLLDIPVYTQQLCSGSTPTWTR